jgi:hypothetical protein
MTAMRKIQIIGIHLGCQIDNFDRKLEDFLGSVVKLMAGNNADLSIFDIESLYIKKSPTLYFCLSIIGTTNMTARAIIKSKDISLHKDVLFFEVINDISIINLCNGSTGIWPTFYAHTSDNRYNYIDFRGLIEAGQALIKSCTEEGS